MAMIRRPERQPKTWDPSREVPETLDRYMGNLFDWTDFPTLWTHPIGEGMWTPGIELVDHNDKYIVRAELPGMKLEDINVSVSDNFLQISGEKKEEKDIKEEEYVYREHRYGSFRRSIRLPSEIDPKKVDAKYENGILEVTMPRTPQGKNKKVQSASRARHSKKLLLLSVEGCLIVNY